MTIVKNGPYNGSPIEDANIAGYSPLFTPSELKRRMPLTAGAETIIRRGRYEIRETLMGDDDRVVIYAGPCSIHDPVVAEDYADRLADLQNALCKSGGNVILAMRVYPEKPRTTGGWPGYVYDPSLDGSGDMEEGLRATRGLLLYVAERGIPAVTEFLDPIIAQYNADTISGGYVGARTVQSPPHRWMGSGLSVPVGFKNTIEGNVQAAVDGAKTARSGHTFTGIDQEGRLATVRTRGNPNTHIVLRGGASPNYCREDVKKALEMLERAGLERHLVVDCSHGNSGKDYRNQPVVFEDVMRQVVDHYPNSGISGIMLESNIYEGSQGMSDPTKLRYGVSITDSCIGWEDTERLILNASEMIGRRRR